MDELQVTARQDGDLGFLAVGGEMRMEIAARLLDSGRELAASGAQHVLVDLTGVIFMDSASLAALIRLDRELGEGKGRLVLYGLSPAVARVLANCGLEGRFPVADDEEGARSLLS
jgi:rsbT co-antagonist protein RsbR